jgi:NADPH2:quinone reductase
MLVPAVGCTRFGGPEVLGPVLVDLPDPDEGAVRVSVRAAAVNPTDVLLRSGSLHQEGATTLWPVVPGMDFAGTVTAARPGCRWGIGDSVIGVTMPWDHQSPGGYASELNVKEASLARAPDGADFAEASTLLMNGLTAFLALDLLALTPGSFVGVTGAAGAVGGYAVGLAKARGLRVVADASEADRRMVTRLGADVVVSRGAGVAVRMQDAAQGPLDGVIDAAMYGPELLAGVRDGGGIAVLRAYDWSSERGISTQLVKVPTYFERGDKMRELVDFVNADVLQLRVSRVLPVDEVGEAHRALEAGGLRGRQVLEWPATR